VRLVDALAAMFEDAAVSAFETADGWSVEIYFATLPDTEHLRHLVADIAGAPAAQRLTFATVSEQDWVAASLAGLKPVSAGRFLVHGSHDRDTANARHGISIEIEAALAFGTGHHGSTRGCLLALDALLKSRRPRHILDVGTGTAVLAIAAAKALHRPVLASDIDRQAVETARENARRNAVAAQTEIIHASAVSLRRIRERAPFELVFANILLAPLKGLAGPIARVAAPDACVILSGLLPLQANAALAVYRSQGFALRRRLAVDGWTTLMLAGPRRMPRIRPKPVAASRRRS
jgi:ribosomal protein L11 methyltransferase